MHNKKHNNSSAHGAFASPNQGTDSDLRPVHFFPLLPTPPGLRSFETQQYDVQFAILFEEADESKGGGAFHGDGGAVEEGEEVIVERQKVDSQLGPITGTIPLSRPGRLTLVWDNG